MSEDDDWMGDKAPYYRVCDEAWEELNRERPGKFSEYDWNDRIIEKGFNPYTGEPLADIEAFKQEQREKEGRWLIMSIERTKRLIGMFAEEMQGGGELDTENVRELHDEYVDELAGIKEELAALNLSPDYIRAVIATVKEMEETVRRSKNPSDFQDPFNVVPDLISGKKKVQTFGTLEQAHKQIGDALVLLTRLYNFVLHELKTTPRSKTGKHIKRLVEASGSRMLFARDSIDEAGKTQQR